LSQTSEEEENCNEYNHDINTDLKFLIFKGNIFLSKNEDLRLGRKSKFRKKLLFSIDATNFWFKWVLLIVHQK